MKTAFILAFAILLPIWSAYFISEYLIQEPEEPEWKTVIIEPIRKFCSTWSQGFQKIQSCNF